MVRYFVIDCTTALREITVCYNRDPGSSVESIYTYYNVSPVLTQCDLIPDNWSKTNLSLQSPEVRSADFP